jgi:hypothetical protein
MKTNAGDMDVVQVHVAVRVSELIILLAITHGEFVEGEVLRLEGRKKGRRRGLRRVAGKRAQGAADVCWF